MRHRSQRLTGFRAGAEAEPRSLTGGTFGLIATPPGGTAPGC